MIEEMEMKLSVVGALTSDRSALSRDRGRLSSCRPAQCHNSSCLFMTSVKLYPLVNNANQTRAIKIAVIEF